MAEGISEAAYNFVVAWKKWDIAASRHSVAADVALKNNRAYYMPTFALKEETEAMLDAKQIWADELGINSVLLTRSLQELRRDGVDHVKAVRLIIKYLEDMHEAS